MKLLLFSGGIESTCLTLISQPDVLITINYGQICAQGEVRAATYIAEQLKIRHEILEVPLADFGAGDLIGRPPLSLGDATEYWPFRNQMLITLAAMKYISEGVSEIIIGTIADDAIHSDGTEEFINRIAAVLNTQHPGLSVTAPAIEMTTAQLVAKSQIGQDLLGWTFSCHKANVSCGHCRGCNKSLELLRKIGHPQVGLP